MRAGENSRVVLERSWTQQGEIQLQQRGAGTYEIIYNGVFLMASYNDHSERILARATIDRLHPGSEGYRMIVGGLGMGFTLQEVLACPQVSRIFVIEIEEQIIEWNRRYFSELNGGALDDSRVILVHSDLFDFLSTVSCHFDALLLDVDNGPSWLAIERNRRLYDEGMLREMERILAPGGLLALWSAQLEPDCWKKLTRVFSRTETIRVTEPDSRRGESLIYLATAHG